MNFTFLHCADLHLGSPLLGLSAKDADVASRFAAASRDAFADLVAKAIEAKVAFVLIAGDVYDGEWRDNSIGLFFNREVSRLTRAHIPAYIIKGNHDAASVVTSTIALPDSVVQFSTRKAETHFIEPLRVAIHGRSFPDRAVNENWAVEYPAPKSGWFNIGLLHTSCDGRPGHAPYAPCTVQDLVARNYDYWALGHVHEYEVLSRDPWVVYPGNIQGRSVRECGAKGAVLVDVADGRVTDVRRLIVDRARFAEMRVDLSHANRADEALEAINAQAGPVARDSRDRLIAIRVRLTGASALHRALLAGRAQFTDDVRAALQHVHDELWLEKLLIETSALAAAASPGVDLAALDMETTLAQCADDPVFHAQATDLLAHIVGKLPGSAQDEDIALDAVMAEARDLVLGRVGGGAA